MHRNSKTKMKNDGVKFKIIGKKRYLTPFSYAKVLSLSPFTHLLFPFTFTYKNYEA